MPRSAVDDAQNMIGERSEQPSPSARVESVPFAPELVADGDEELLARHEREDARVDQRLDHVLFPAGDLGQVGAQGSELE